MRKAICIILCGVLAFGILSGCNAQRLEKNTKSQTLSADEILKPLGYDIANYVTLPKNYKNMTIDLQGTMTYNKKNIKKFINESIKDIPDYEKAKDPVIKEDSIIKIKCVQSVEGQSPSDLGDDYILYMGKQYFPENSDKNFLGKKSGDSFDFTITFTKESGKELEGRKCNFKGKIIDVYKEITLDYDTITDEYVVRNFKDIYNVNTAKEYIKLKEKEFKKSLETDRPAKIKLELEEKIAKESQITVPESETKAALESMKETIKEDAKSIGIPYEDYIKQAYGSEGEEGLKKEVNENLRKILVKDAVIKDMGITITKEEFEQYAEKKVKNKEYNSKEEFYKIYGSKEKAIIGYAEEKVLDILAKKVNIIN